MNNNIVFDNDPFNHIDIFQFSDFDTENMSLPKAEEINSLKVYPGHLALLNPTILRDNDLEGQLDLAMKMGIGSNQNVHKILNEPNKKIQDKKITTTRKTTKTPTTTNTKVEKEKEKLQPKKRGRKSTTTKSCNKNEDSEDECTNIKLPQKFQYLEEKERLGTLTEEDEKILKKERRLIKNRESAQQFRKRQKMHTIELQEKVDNLTDENLHLKHTVESLNKDKEQLEIQIKNLWQFVNKAFTFAVPYRVEQNTYPNTNYHFNSGYQRQPPQQHLLPHQHHQPLLNHLPQHLSQNHPHHLPDHNKSN